MELNALSLFIPGDTVHTTIQAAVNAAHQAPGGAVWITASYTGHDTYTNPSSVPVFDMRGTGSVSFAAGGGTPGGSNTQVQFNNSGAFGADSEFTWDSATHRGYSGPPASDFNATMQGYLGTIGTQTATIKNAATDTDQFRTALLFVAQNDRDNPNYALGIYGAVAGTGGGNITGSEADIYAQPANGKQIFQATGLYGYAQGDGPGQVLSLNAVYANAGTTGGITNTQTGFWADSNFISGGTVSNNYGFYCSNQGAIGSSYNAAYYAAAQGSFGATKDYLVWFDTPNGNAVYRIKNDGVMGYYNPSFSPKYTPGSQDFERVVIQWTSDVCEIGTQKGTDSGALRPLRLLGSNVIIPGSTPASAAATGVAGTVTWDASFIYVCTATDTWKRVAISTWP